MWLWPIFKFWTFSPLGWALAVVWNVCEICHCKVPFAPKVFEIIIGYKGEKINDD